MLEFEKRCVCEASEGWIGRTEAIEFHFVVLICVPEGIRVDVMGRRDEYHDLLSLGKDAIKSIDEHYFTQTFKLRDRCHKSVPQICVTNLCHSSCAVYA